jgi:N-methylhydantoinase B
MSRTSKTTPSRRAAPKRAAPRHAALRDRRSQVAAPDQIKVSVIGNRLDAISREIGQTMLRTSRSPIFSEARDFVTAIFDAQTRLVAQTAYIPVLMGALPYALRSIAKTFEGDVDDGDIFILNDPYRGNNHPPDITIAKPVFHAARSRSGPSKGHHADVGGGGVAGYKPGAKVTWEEGIRIPPAKLYIAGKANKALWDTILLNVHLPFLVEGDLQCQVGAVTIGERSLKALLAKYGRPMLDAAIDSIFDASERQMRAAIRSVPEGAYTAERLMDHDGIVKDHMIKVQVTCRIAKGEITFDFTGSDSQVPGYVNSTLPNTASSAFLALFMSLGSDIRFNEGALRALHVVAPVGSVVNPVEPAACTGCTIASAQAISRRWLALAGSAGPGRRLLVALVRARDHGLQSADGPAVWRHPLHVQGWWRCKPGPRRLEPHRHRRLRRRASCAGS